MLKPLSQMIRNDLKPKDVETLESNRNEPDAVDEIERALTNVMSNERWWMMSFVEDSEKKMVDEGMIDQIHANLKSLEKNHRQFVIVILVSFVGEKESWEVYHEEEAEMFKPLCVVDEIEERNWDVEIVDKIEGRSWDVESVSVLKKKKVRLKTTSFYLKKNLMTNRAQPFLNPLISNPILNKS